MRIGFPTFSPFPPTTNVEGVPFLQLPPEVHLEIAKRLPVDSLLQFSLACRTTCNVALSPYAASCLLRRGEVCAAAALKESEASSRVGDVEKREEAEKKAAALAGEFIAVLRSVGSYQVLDQQDKANVLIGLAPRISSLPLNSRFEAFKEAYTQGKALTASHWHDVIRCLVSLIPQLSEEEHQAPAIELLTSELDGEHQAAVLSGMADRMKDMQASFHVPLFKEVLRQTGKLKGANRSAVIVVWAPCIPKLPPDFLIEAWNTMYKRATKLTGKDRALALCALVTPALSLPKDRVETFEIFRREAKSMDGDDRAILLAGLCPLISHLPPDTQFSPFDDIYELYTEANGMSAAKKAAVLKALAHQIGIWVGAIEMQGQLAETIQRINDVCRAASSLNGNHRVEVITPLIDPITRLPESDALVKQIYQLYKEADVVDKEARLPFFKQLFKSLKYASTARWRDEFFLLQKYSVKLEGKIEKFLSPMIDSIHRLDVLPLETEIRNILQTIQCIEKNARSKDPLPRELCPQTFQELVAKAKELMQAYREILGLCYRAEGKLRKIPNKYNMAQQLWWNGIEQTFELLRKNSEFNDARWHIPRFMHHSYYFLKGIQADIPANKEAMNGHDWVEESLGEIARWHFSLIPTEAEKEQWRKISLHHFACVVRQTPETGRLYHHISILEQDPEIKLACIGKSFIARIPFRAAERTLDANLRNPPAGLTAPLWQMYHASLQGNPLDEEVTELAGDFLRNLEQELDGNTENFRDTGLHIAAALISGAIGFRLENNGIREIFDQSRSIPEDARIGAVPAACTLAFDSFAKVIQRFNQSQTADGAQHDDNLLPFINLFFSFLHGASRNPLGNQLIDALPWPKIASMLNSMSRARDFDENVSKSPYRPDLGDVELREDFFINGSIWDRQHKPAEAATSRQEAEDPALQNQIRRYRILALATQISENCPSLSFDGKYRASHCASENLNIR